MLHYVMMVAAATKPTSTTAGGSYLHSAVVLKPLLQVAHLSITCSNDCLLMNNPGNHAVKS